MGLSEILDDASFYVSVDSIAKHKSMTEIAAIHVHMFNFLSVSENLWLCSVRVQEYLFHCIKVSPVVIIFLLLLLFFLFVPFVLLDLLFYV
jgi:hypothetical protein